MRVLFVAISQVSSGESITALHMAEWLVAEGYDVQYIASVFTETFVCDRLRGAVTSLGPDRRSNQRTWSTLLRRFKPAAIVFADYPLLAFSSGTAPLRDEAWEAALDRVDAELFTLDHLGYAQTARLLFFGPPQGTLGIERIPPIPSRMQILLPCPMHHPDQTLLLGRPFRYWNARPQPRRPEPSNACNPYVRSTRELLVLHVTSGWTCRAAELLKHPYYALFPRLLFSFFSSLARPVTVLSVNNGSLLPEVEHKNVRIRNVSPMRPVEYERLLMDSNLIITENRISVSLAKAISLLRPCAALHNSYSLTEIVNRPSPSSRSLAEEMERLQVASVFPFEVFPIWSRDDLEQLQIYDDSCLGGAFAAVEVFDGHPAAKQLQDLLLDDSSIEAIRIAQLSYLARVQSTASPAEVLSGAQTRCGTTTPTGACWT